MWLALLLPPSVALAASAAPSTAAAFLPRPPPPPIVDRSLRNNDRRCPALVPRSPARPLAATKAESDDSAAATAAATPSSQVGAAVLSALPPASGPSREWGETFGLTGPEATFHALFSAIASSAPLGLGGAPFLLKADDVSSVLGGGFEPLAGFFTYDDLARAVEDDFLDADRGSTDNRRGWKVTGVSKPRGQSFEEARMTKEEVDAALEKGTVIFSAAGAHIPKLAGATLACTDAASLPCALNIYITAAGKRTSAPPHTDRQDVIVVQTQGRKRWRVYSPPDPSRDPAADPFARGKGDDDLPLHALEDGRAGCERLLDVTLDPGDVLFVPASFPHTTDTAASEPGRAEDTSVHLTFNFDTHVWDLDYLSARRLALRRAGVADDALGRGVADDRRYTGKANELPKSVREELFRALPLGLLDDEGDSNDVQSLVGIATAELERIAHVVDPDTASQVPSGVWMETIEALRREGLKLMDIHRDMYLAAVEEGRMRKAEDEMTAHLGGVRALTPERMQRLSVFRVREYYTKINEAKAALVEWSKSGIEALGDTTGDTAHALPDNWEFTSPLKVGDDVEADLGGAFFPAVVTTISAGQYNVRFFDGDVMDGLSRDMIKLLTPPLPEGGSGQEEQPPPGLTKKELKRWLKKQEKKASKGL